MVHRSDVLNPADVCRPLPLPGIERSREQKILLRMASRRLQQQLVQFGLAISGVRSHIAKVADEIAAGLSAQIIIGINASVKWSHHTRAILLFQLLHYPAASKGKDQ